jgi:8-oxo-dGTP diphosphatase
VATVHVVAACVVRDGLVLATQRGYGAFAGRWEFPGGKVEAGELPADALRREIAEELAADVVVGPHLGTVGHDYPDFHIELAAYLCTLAGGFDLREHQAARWLSPAEFDTVDWLPPDLALLPHLVAAIKGQG